MPTTTPAMFTFPLGDDAVLIPRTPAITEAFHELLVANHERLIRWNLLREANPTPDGRHDEVLYGLLSNEWNKDRA